MHISDALSKQVGALEVKSEESVELSSLSHCCEDMDWVSLSAALIFVGICCFFVLCIRRCRRKKAEPTPVVKLSSPRLRRRFSEHPVYPPTPPTFPHPLLFNGHSSLRLSASLDTLSDVELDSAGRQAVLTCKVAHEQQTEPVGNAGTEQPGVVSPQEGEMTVSIAMPEYTQPGGAVPKKEVPQTEQQNTPEPMCEQPGTRRMSGCELDMNTVEDSNSVSRNL